MDQARDKGHIRIHSPSFLKLILFDLYLRNVSVVLRRVSTIVTCFPLPFISYTLDEIFVEVADIQVPYLMGSKLK